MNPHKNFTLLQIPNEISGFLLTTSPPSNPIKRNRPPPFLHVFPYVFPHLFLPKLAKLGAGTAQLCGPGPWWPAVELQRAGWVATRHARADGGGTWGVSIVSMGSPIAGWRFWIFSFSSWFYAFPASLLFRLLLLSLLLCFSASLFSLLLCFSAFVLLCLSTSTILLFLFFGHVFLLLYFLLLCFFASCLYCLCVFHFLLLYSFPFVS